MTEVNARRRYGKYNTQGNDATPSFGRYSVRFYKGSCCSGFLLVILILIISYSVTYIHRDSRTFLNSDSYRQHFMCRECFKQAESNATVCGQSTGGVIDLIIVVLSRSAMTSDRDRIRKSWASALKRTNRSVRLVFLLPYAEICDNADMRKEVSANSDMVFGDIDKYNALPHQAMSAVGLEWAATFCGKAKHYMQTMSNAWVNVSRIVRIIHEEEEFLRFGMVGDCLNPSHDKFTGDSPLTYTTDCSTSTFVVSMDTVNTLLEVVRIMPLKELEELYHTFRLLKHKGDPESSLEACARVDASIVGYEFNAPDRKIRLQRNCYSDYPF